MAKRVLPFSIFYTLYIVLSLMKFWRNLMFFGVNLLVLIALGCAEKNSFSCLLAVQKKLLKFKID